MEALGKDKVDTDSLDSNSKPIPQERAFLESYFYTVAQFQFDRAHDLSEKEKEQFKPIPGTLWMALLSSLTNFAVVEKSYFSMAFVERRLLRREVIRPLYCNLSSELKKLFSHSENKNQSIRGRHNTMETLSLEISKQLHQFIEARLKMIDFYEFMAKSGWSRINNTNELIKAITEVNQEFSKKFHHPILDPLKTSFTYEVDVVLMLFQTKVYLSEWEFLNSLLALKECQTKLHAWCMLHPSLSVKDQLMSTFSYKSFFGRSNKKQTDIPFLYHWLYQFYENLLSKFTFYFYTTLSAQAPVADIKTTVTKTNIDYMGKLNNFEKKTDTSCISVVLDTSTKKNIYRGHGYHLDNTIREQPTGMNSFPSIVNIPEIKPKEHWPNVISMITDHSEELHATDKIIYFFDSKLESSYYLIKIDVRMTLVLIYNSKKKERDSYIQGFLTDMRALLQHDNMYQMLKPGQVKVFEKN